MSLIRKDKDIPAAAPVPAAPLRLRRGRLSFLGPGHRLSPAGAARRHHDRGRAGGGRGPSAPGRACPGPCGGGGGVPSEPWGAGARGGAWVWARCIAPRKPGSRAQSGAGRRRGAARPVPGASGHCLLLPWADHAAAQLVSPASKKSGTSGPPGECAGVFSVGHEHRSPAGVGEPPRRAVQGFLPRARAASLPAQRRAGTPGRATALRGGGLCRNLSYDFTERGKLYLQRVFFDKILL